MLWCALLKRNFPLHKSGVKFLCPKPIPVGFQRAGCVLENIKLNSNNWRMKLSTPLTGFLKPFAAIVLFLLCSFLSWSQDTGIKYNPADYKDKPVWIDMMNDPGANFFETVAAFREFWQGYDLPGEPDEMEANGRFKRDVGLKTDKPKVAPAQAPAELPKRISPQGWDYTYEVKSFMGWFRDTQPWVREDGSILQAEERQQLIDNQQQELKKIESRQ